MREPESSGWHDCGEMLPDAGGEYEVIRRALGGRPHYEDRARFEPGTDGEPGYWTNLRGVRIQTVEKWREHRYMVIITHTGGKQTAEFYDDAEDLAYIGLGEWDDYEDLYYYELDEAGNYVPMMSEIRKTEEE